MNEQEVKDYLWKQFLAKMRGHTVTINKDGSIDYYDYDVQRIL